MSSTPREIVIVGGGIIGCTTAYYITRYPSFSSSSTKLTLIEASKHGPAHGASGKAGGLVARWAYPKDIVDVSFNEHVKLAKEHGGEKRWGWREVGCGSWEGRAAAGVVEGMEKKPGLRSLEKENGLPGGQKPRRQMKKNGIPEDLLWIDEPLTESYTPMAKPGETAQVHPYEFTTAMFDLARGQGLAYISGKVTQILTSDSKVTGVEYIDPTTQESKMLHATDIILTSGAWSPSLLSSLPITATRAHSITIHPRAGTIIAPYVLFTEITSSNGKTSSPEIYARPTNEIYACGQGDDSVLPATVDDVVVDQEACETIWKDIVGISTVLREDGTVDKRQACFLPTVSRGGGPIIGDVPGTKGLFVGTGHTCWGISNGPGTGKALSELVMEGKIKCANLKKLHPSRYLE